MGFDERISVARVYDPTTGSGHRVLVDRLWPRGMARSDVMLDEWLKEVAPSSDLRRWYGHDPALYDEFATRYREELDQPPAREAAAHLLDVARVDDLVLLTATRDIDHSGARVLFDHLVTLEGGVDDVATSRSAPGDTAASRSGTAHAGADGPSTAGLPIGDAPDRSSSGPYAPLTRSEALEVLVDRWVEDSFPASDPPGRLPPSLSDEGDGAAGEG